MNNQNTDNSGSVNIKLPSIVLPQFSGYYSEWINFKLQFTTLIDENKQLTESQKLYYLQSALIGPAKHMQNIDDS